jgi:hypothetical protein
MYEVNITAAQFIAIDSYMSSFKCSLEVFLSDTERFVKIIGNAVDIANPVVVFFKLPRPNRKYVEILRNETNPLVFQCIIELRGRNQSKISAKIEELKPLTALIGENRIGIYSSLNGRQQYNSTDRKYKSSDSSPYLFKKQISLTTEDFRLTDIVSVCAEAINANAIGEFRAILNATVGIRDSLNKTLTDVKQKERNMSTRIDCALAMSTRDDYMRPMLLGANLSACSQFFISGTIIKFY